MSEALSPGWPPRSGAAAAHRRDQLAPARAALGDVTEALTDEMTSDEVLLALATRAAYRLLARRRDRGGAARVVLEQTISELVHEIHETARMLP